VFDAIAGGCGNSHEIQERTGIPGSSPYTSQLHSDGLIEKVRSLNYEGLGKSGRRVNQHAWEWRLSEKRKALARKRKVEILMPAPIPASINI
jgi:hypothetical protein